MLFDILLQLHELHILDKSLVIPMNLMVSTSIFERILYRFYDIDQVKSE